MAFPSDIHTAYTFTDNTTDVLAEHPNVLSAEIRAIETKLGITSSTDSVNWNVDYFLRNASGAFRTHIHDGGSDDGAAIPGSSLTTLGGISSGAGIIPVANIDVGTTANKIVQLTAAAKLPAVDGSLLTNLPVSGFTSRVRAFLNSAATCNALTWTKVPLDTDSGTGGYDTLGEFSTSTNTFTATTTGYYLVCAALQMASPDDGIRIGVGIYKNGALYSMNINCASGTTGEGASVSDIIPLSATDTLEMYIYSTHSSGTKSLGTDYKTTFMSIHRLS